MDEVMQQRGLGNKSSPREMTSRTIGRSGSELGLRGACAGLLMAALAAGYSGCASSGAVGERPALPEAGKTEASPAVKAPAAGGSETHGEAGQPPAPLADPCSLLPRGSGRWLDRVHSWTSRVACATILGFDGFFGDARAEDEKDLPSGLVGLRLRWSEHDALWNKLRFRMRFNLPNLNRRLKGFIGRETEDEYLRDTAESGIVRELSQEREYKWVAGLGFSPLKEGRSRLRLSGGLTVSASPQLYSKARYRWYFPLGLGRLGRFRQTVFWRNRDGWGTTSSLDIEQHFSSRFLLRWGANGTLSEISDGIEWYSGLTLYEQLGVDSAAYYRIWIRGATDADVHTQEYGFFSLYRHRMFREWFFGEVGGGISWIPDHPWARRKASVGVLVGVEMQFGAGSPH